MFWTGFLTATVIFGTALAGYFEFRRPYWHNMPIKPFEMTEARRRVIADSLRKH